MGNLRDKVLGMLVASAAGDGLGFPVETWDPERIVQTHGGPLTGYVDPKGHRWFNAKSMPAGSTTDDTQLKKATMVGLMRGKSAGQQDNYEALVGEHYMDAIAQTHCEAMAESVAGWGGTTKDAVRFLREGKSWRESGKLVEGTFRGTGNGVPMKIAPLAAWHLSRIGKLAQSSFSFNQFCIDYSAMTHYSKMSAEAAIVHAQSIVYCLSHSPEDFSRDALLDLIDSLLALATGKVVTRWSTAHLRDTNDQLSTCFEFLSRERERIPEMTVEELRQVFGKGSCYLYDSFPFTYAFFLRNPSPQVVLDLVNAGGDTDTNASMAGDLVGALYGLDALGKTHDWMIDGLRGVKGLMDLGNSFCDTFEIP